MTQLKATLLTFLIAACTFANASALAPAPSTQETGLRIFIRAGEKTHGPGQHDHPRFLAEWTELLNQRGAQTSGALRFPTDEELAATDVLVMYAAEAATIEGDERVRFEAFQARGGGLVLIHDAVCGTHAEWFKTRTGGAWEHGHSKWYEGKVGLYFGDPHPITRGIPHFDIQDEIYYDLHMAPEAQVLANSFHDIFDMAPQMWVVDEQNRRVFSTLQGHNHTSFSHPAFRALLLRGIAWAGRREIDSLTAPAELEHLRYPPGGPLAPEHAAEPFELHEDFELNLVAAEPMLVNPISIDWDMRGRMWVAQTPGYPYKQEFSGIPAHDEITILEDLDGDGRMDSAKTFADGLDLVTSFVFHGNGVIVTQAPHILWLRDNDGDDVADERIVLYTGFGYADTHAVTSNLRWGLDGWIYGTQGYSGNASRDIRSPYHDSQEPGTTSAYGHIPNGVFRFQPDGSAIEPYSVYGSNTWGLDFDPNGELFFSMANGSHLRHVLLSEQDLGSTRLPGTNTWRDIVDHRKVQRISKADRAAYVQIDFVGGFTAASGCTIYSGGVWPEEFAGNHFVCEPTVNLVHRDVLTQKGASYVASKPRETEFLASTDPWFRPVQTRVGPDGALYVLDFYNQAAVHNDTRGPQHGPTNAAKRPDRDRHHGRVWRVQHKQALSAPPAGTNFWNAMRTLRGLREGTAPAGDAPRIDDPSPAVRVRALWHALHSGQIDTPLLQRALGDADAGVRRAAARVAGDLPEGMRTPDLATSLGLRVTDKDPRVQLAVLTALRHHDLQPMVIESLVPNYVVLEDNWSRSAFLRVAQAHVEEFLASAIQMQQRSSDPQEAAAIQELAQRLVAIQARAGDASAIVQTLAQLVEAGDGVAAALPTMLRAIQDSLKPDFAFGAEDARAGDALTDLLEAHAGNVEVQSAVLPLAARVRGSARLSESIASLAGGFLLVVDDVDADLDSRLRALSTLLELPAAREAAIAAADGFLYPYFSLETQARVIEGLAGTGDVQAGRVLAQAFARLSNQARDQIFQQLISRPDWTACLLDEVQAEEIQITELGPRRTFRLRQHADPATAVRARSVLDLHSAPAPEMQELLASLVPVVREPGNRERGLEVFTQNCAVCHRHEGLPEGAGADVGPSLVGMGSHGAEHLLPFIIDPNRSVEAAYLEYVAETTDGQLIAGVLTYDGPDSITISHSGGAESILREDLESLRSTGRSPMPTGFETLGNDSIRDLLMFLCAGFEDYRVIDLRAQFNSSTSLGLYDRRYDAHAMRFRSFGVVDVFETPMQVHDPAKLPDNNNAIVLKGGARAEWESKVLRPQRVDIAIGHALQRMHVLGGISAWGHPFFGEEDPVLTWTFHYADGTDELHVLHDGIEFADWIGRHDVPGSEYVEDLLAPGSVGQVRYFSIDPKKTAVVVESLTLESFDNRMAPTFLALTAQVHGAEPRQVRAAEPLTQPRVLIVGGGTSHDWSRWYEGSLQTTMGTGTEFEPSTVEYTTRLSQVLPRLATLKVLALCNNQEPRDDDLREGIRGFVARGGGLLILHAATWYNWADWPAYNRELVGGGARGHEAYGAFDVRIEDAEHPLMKGLPATFEISDELYRFEPAADGAAIKVLARGISRATGETYPVAWTVKSAGGRIFCSTLGHDGAAHNNAAFQRMIRNALEWSAESVQSEPK